MNHQYWVYIMGSFSGVLYIGCTNNLQRRVFEHVEGKYQGSFTKKYRCKRLLYYEEYQWIHEAFEREHQLKRWRRSKKKALIVQLNPDMKDLASEIGYRVDEVQGFSTPLRSGRNIKEVECFDQSEPPYRQGNFG